MKKSTLSLKTWGHHQFLQNLKGKKVYLVAEGLIIAGVLLDFDQWTLLMLVDGDTETSVIFKHAVRAIQKAPAA